MYNPLPKTLYDSLWMKCSYEIADAKSTLQIYFESSVGIGEHPQHTEEMTKLLQKLGEAEERKSVLERHYKDIYGDMKHGSKK
jgi:hypothetical protein